MNRELEELEQEELDKELIGVVPSTEELPEVPTGEVKEPSAAIEKKKGIFFTVDTSISISHSHNNFFTSSSTAQTS